VDKDADVKMVEKPCLVQFNIWKEKDISEVEAVNSVNERIE